MGHLFHVRRRRRYRLRPRSPLATAPLDTVPGVSILRPLKGLDTNLYENLESTFTQEYPNYEIIFSVADENDQALGVVNELIARYPRVKAEIIVGKVFFVLRGLSSLVFCLCSCGIYQLQAKRL